MTRRIEQTFFAITHFIIIGCSTLFPIISPAARAETVRESMPNGFDLTNIIISPDDIMSGGPGRDGIPSIDQPVFVSPSAVDFLKPEDVVVSFQQDSETRAYPIRILAWHEIVNDQIGSEPFIVTYCPLCGTAMVFHRKINGRVLTFGVSGLLYQSDVLLYDRETESLWSQLGMKSVAGSMANTILEWLPSETMTWSSWKQQFPNGRVLSTETGFSRDYSENAYEEYSNSPEPIFPAPKTRQELPRKAWVLGILIGREAKAYPLGRIPANRPIIDQVGNLTLEVSYDPSRDQPIVRNRDSGQTVPHVRSYWFAWQAFYPETGLWNGY